LKIKDSCQDGYEAIVFEFQMHLLYALLFCVWNSANYISPLPESVELCQQGAVEGKWKATDERKNIAAASNLFFPITSIPEKGLPMGTTIGSSMYACM
jgi:hypothetical protein